MAKRNQPRVSPPQGGPQTADATKGDGLGGGEQIGVMSGLIMMTQAAAKLGKITADALILRFTEVALVRAAIFNRPRLCPAPPFSTGLNTSRPLNRVYIRGASVRCYTGLRYIGRVNL
jgi:hypothetical protein